jgi:hypothetical protein
MSLEVRLTNVLQCLQQNGLSAAGFISGVLDSRHTVHANGQESLTMNAAQICAQLYNDKNSRSLVFAWAAGTLHGELCKEVTELSLKQHGLYFKAASTTVEQLETTFMSQLAVKMQSVASNLWNLVLALLDSRENCHQKMPCHTSGHDSIPEEYFA